MIAQKFTIQHSSMEVFDSAAQQIEDAAKVLGTGNEIICGTEAGASNPVLRRALKRNAKINGYYLFFGGKSDSWIAVRKDFVTDGTRPVWKYQQLFKSAKAAGDPNGPYGSRGIVSGTFHVDDIGVVSVGTAHFLTKGRTPDQTPPGKFNHYLMNTRYIRAVGDWAERNGRKRRLAFFTADTNIPDDKMDVFRGEPLTTCWDELDKHPNTGHGNIDVVASYDLDGRVSCTGARVLLLDLHSDHKTIEATYKVETLTG